MMFVLSFYIFSFILSYFDFKKFLVPNDIVIALAGMLLVFGFIESKIFLSSIILTLVVLLFFIGIILINRQMILGGGDIKYMMIVSLYLGLKPFALFLVLSGILQTFSLLYVQRVKKRRIAPMVPMMFLATIIVDILVVKGIYPFIF